MAGLTARLVVALAGLFALLMLFAPAAGAESSEQLYARLRASVVKIHVQEFIRDSETELPLTMVPSEGSGVILSADGKILTAAHLVQTADEIVVEFADGQRVPARVHAAEPAADVALLQLGALPAGRLPAPLGRSEATRTGQPVIVIGAPFGLPGMVTVGHVSGRHRPATPFGNMKQLEMFVLDAYVERGSSGGGVFDTDGQLIGMVTSVQFRTGRSQGLGFAVTAGTVRALLVERRSLWTGIGGYWVCGPLAQWLNLPQSAGLLVQRVARNSPAAQLQLQGGSSTARIDDEDFVIGGDIILRAQGVLLAGVDDYARMQAELAKLQAGDSLRMTVLRGGRLIELSAPVQR